jgi:hypothetical protein
VLEADIKGFFDNVSHECLLRCLEVRIQDPSLLLCRKTSAKRMRRALAELNVWLNRRSQKASFTWAGFAEYLKYYPLPRPLRLGLTRVETR